MRPKKQKPPICIGGSEKLRAMDRPRYMNVPSPAPCHVNVAGVGKQSVWGLRIIACISNITLASFFDFVNTQKWWYPKVVEKWWLLSGLPTRTKPLARRT